MLRKRFAIFAMATSAVLAAGLAAQTVRADDKADALLAEVRATTAATETLNGNFSYVQIVAGIETKFDGRFALKRPNFAHIDLSEPLAQTIVSDGKTVWLLFQGAVGGGGRPVRQYTKRPADPTGLTVAICAPITWFFHPGMIGAAAQQPAGGKPPVVTTKLLPREKIEGTEYQVIEMSQEKPSPATMRIYIGPDKRLARAMVERKGSTPSTVTYTLKNVKAGEPQNDRDFVFTPPKDATLLSNPTPLTPSPALGKPVRPGQ